ncbi:putative polysaccharide biosynthesis protein [Desulfoscipio geothermicus]|uniref:Stage V sporulation protein B n=1 Tax=Desulfoscipio geothermicus DSM 3669 TaxID=1121426 RepID=A0A1I6EAK4_9FIRM|nr:polysaccharide biosynthesis protein [Desulfoscipio geothermicus]SFR14518.1 stage V sporulation protein B [Desulfoscipio geothermicus DSM 3669]
MSKSPFNKQTVLQGAITLTIAWLFIRILGAVYRIPLGRMLGDEGLGIYAVPNQFYLLFFTLTSAGIPVAVASIISEKMAVGHYRDALRTFRVARGVMFLVGLAFSILLFAGAGWLIESGLVPSPDAYLGMRAIAPVIFFAAVTAAYRGLFQGMQNMRVVAYSQVADQVMLVTATLLFSYLLLPHGPAIAAAGANLGAVPGAVGATLMLVYLYRRQRRDIVAMAREDTSGIREGTFSLLKRIFSTALPVSFAGVAMSITGIIDHKLIVDRLQLVGYSHQQAIAQFGQFNQMAMSFINISTALAVSLGASLVPAVAESFALKNLDRIRYQLLQALRLVIIFSLPAAAGLYILAPQLTLLLFAEESAGVPLAALSAVAVFWSVHLVTSGALQGMGRAVVPVRNLVIGILVKLLITYYLTPTPLGIRAAAMGTVIIFALSSSLNLVSIARLVDFKFNIQEMFWRPGLATLVMSAGVLLVYRAAAGQIGGNNWPTLIAVVSGALVYPLVLVVLGGLKAEDMRRLPGIGARLAALLDKIGSR